ncbi:PAS domain-containing sensor histidine kinase [Acidovorax sp. RAC01]|uniref:PAS domain-containing sensor histidine kinase n=1 Tax=Acidovorax sp. RAC01 TaxID=1842533 RepID=UPI0008550D63|nr:PAS domain-containing sensor histidine kinase [Acidovorax sp. RAC01]AOG24040.1 sensory box protein [Acidovorax sp. RAC01]
MSTVSGKQNVRADATTASAVVNYRLLVESLKDVLWVVDVEASRLMYVSPSVVELRGMTPAEAIAESATFPGGSGDLARFYVQMKERATDFQLGRISEVHRFVDELELSHKDGSTVYAEMISHYQHNPSSGRLEAYGLARDITQRRKAEEDLRLSEIRHRLLAEYANDVIWTMGPDGAVTYVSPAVQKVRGFTQEEAAAQTIDQILTPPSQASAMGYFAQMLQAIADGRTPPVYEAEQEYYCKDGSTIWTEVRAFPVLARDGSLIELLGMTRDIHVRKRYEDELRQAHAQLATANEQLIAANRKLARLADVAQQQAATERTLREEQERLFTMLAHELKTPLATVRMVAADLPGSPATTIASAVRDMNDVIERCVQSGQLNDGRMVPRREQCDLGVLLSQAVQSGRWRGRVDTTLPVVPAVVHSDEQMVRIIIDNLIDNAAKYSAPGSRVSVAVSVHRQGAVAGHAIRIANLPGPAGWPDPGSVFQKYYRAPHAQRQSGAGLGLFLVDSLTRLLGGHIDYAPTDTEVAFVCWLPLDGARAVKPGRGAA